MAPFLPVNQSVMVATTAFIALLQISALDVQAIKEPLTAPEAKWATTSSPYGTIVAPRQRVLVVSNGPAYIDESTFPKGANHVNLYAGAIPFEGSEIHLRVMLYHVIAPKSKVSDVDVRLCLGLGGAGGSVAKIKALRWTRAHPDAKQARNYMDVGRALATAHLTNSFQHVWSGAEGVTIPTDDQSGDILEPGLHLRTSVENEQFEGMVAEIDIDANAAMAGRNLVVRTVAVQPGGEVGNGKEMSCANPGVGDRGWWPKADMNVMTDPKRPIAISSDPGMAAYLPIAMPGADRTDWSQYNRMDRTGAVTTTNRLDLNGTHNVSMLGVNTLYTIHYRSSDNTSGFLDAAIIGLNGPYAAGQVVAGPFEMHDRPWARYAEGRLAPLARWSIVSKRAADDFDMASLGRAAVVDDSNRTVSFMIANSGTSMLPTGLTLMRAR